MCSSRLVARDYAFLHHDGPIAFAHRGGALYPPNVGIENSMGAFQAAIDLGYRYLETDVHVTADGVVVAFHDPLLDRSTNATGPLEQLTYDELARAKIAGRERIPAVAEMLAAWPDARLNLDVKTAAAIVPLVRLLRDTQAFERVCVASFNPVRIHRVRRLAGPRLATAYGPVGVAALRLLPVRALRDWLLGGPIPCLQVPRRAHGIELVTAAFVESAHALGKHVHVWTVNEAAAMHELLDLGVDGIMTDEIDTLRSVLRARGQWNAP